MLREDGELKSWSFLMDHGEDRKRHLRCKNTGRKNSVRVTEHMRVAG